MTDSRLQSLGDLLGPKAAARPPRVVVVPDVEPNDTTGPVGESETTSTARTSPRHVRQRPNATVATKPRVALRLPPDLHERLAEHAVQERLSYAAVLLLAVEGAYAAEVFPELLVEHRRRQAEADGGVGLFSPQAPRPKPEPKVPVEFQPNHADLRTLDELWRRFDAKDRTEFLTVALEHYFSVTS
jgi:hypothetical protein